MRHHLGGCPFSAPILSTQRVDAGAALVRVLCLGPRAGSRHMLLHPTVPHQEPANRGSLPRLSTIIYYCAVGWVSLFVLSPIGLFLMDFTEIICH